MMWEYTSLQSMERFRTRNILFCTSPTVGRDRIRIGFSKPKFTILVSFGEPDLMEQIALIFLELFQSISHANIKPFSGSSDQCWGARADYSHHAQLV